MLAERSTYKSPWELERERALQEEQARILERKRQKEKARQERNVLLRKYVSAVVLIVAGTYAVSVVRSEAFATVGRELVVMKQQEKLLRSKNDELKIEVEELKGPTRIIRLAEQKLGMHVARNNIYVKGL